MIEKQLILPTLEDWIDIGGGASVRLPIAIIKLAPKSAKGHCIAAGHVGIKQPTASEKSATESKAGAALSNPAITSVLMTSKIAKKCAHCGKPLKRKSKNGRFPKFCNSLCRMRAWRAKQKAVKS